MNFCTFWKVEIAQLTKSRVSKSAIITHWGALNFDSMHFCTCKKIKLTKLTKFRAPKTAKAAFLELQDSPELISHKIWVTEKSWNFHTVYNTVSTAQNGSSEHLPKWEGEIQMQESKGKNCVFNLCVAMSLVASATEILASWPTQANLFPSEEKFTECTQPPH